MAVTVEVEHPLPVSVPGPANGLNLRIAWKPVNGHGGGRVVDERMPLAPVSQTASGPMGGRTTRSCALSGQEVFWRSGLPTGPLGGPAPGGGVQDALA